MAQGVSLCHSHQAVFTRRKGSFPPHLLHTANGLQGGGVVNIIMYRHGDVYTCCVFHMKLQVAFVFCQHLLGQATYQLYGFSVQHHTQFSLMGLTGKIGHSNRCHKAVVLSAQCHVLFTIGHHKGHHHFKTSVVSRNHRVSSQQFAVAKVAFSHAMSRIAIQEGKFAPYINARLGTLHRHPRIGGGFSTHHQGISFMIGRIDFGESHLEGGTLVGCHFYALRSPLSSQSVATRCGILCQHKIGCSLAILIGNNSAHPHLFSHGIAQSHSQRFACQCMVLPALGLYRQHSHPHCLSGAIHCPVGIEIGAPACIPALVSILETTGIEWRLGHRLILCSIGINRIRGHGSHHIRSLSLGITDKLHGSRSLMTEVEVQTSMRQWFSSGAIHHAIVHAVLGHRLLQHIHIRHV